jgi:hypothetical protein
LIWRKEAALIGASNGRPSSTILAIGSSAALHKSPAMLQPHFSPRSAAPVVALPVITMARFRRLMQREGWAVDLPRMCVDNTYAYECLALAHSTVCEPLRRVALELFSTYDRNQNGEPIASAALH